MQTITYVSHKSYLFKGTVRDNLRMGRADASDDDTVGCAETRKPVRISAAAKTDWTPELAEKGVKPVRRSVSAARAWRARLLHDSPVYIFDEATSNIDVESENDIMARDTTAG